MGALSGLEGIIARILKKTKPEEKDTKFVKALEYTLSGIAYPIAGVFPAELQRREGKKAEIDPLKFTKYSIGITVVTGCAKYFIAWNAENVPILEYPSTWLAYWALVGNGISILARAGYVISQKKPIGPLIVEAIYHIIPSKIIGKYEKRNKNNHIRAEGLIEKE